MTAELQQKAHRSSSMGNQILLVILSLVMLWSSANFIYLLTFLSAVYRCYLEEKRNNLEVGPNCFLPIVFLYSMFSISYFNEIARNAKIMLLTGCH